MTTVSIHFFQLSAMAPGTMRDCCVIIPSEGDSFPVDSLSRTAKDVLCPVVVPAHAALDLKLLQSPRYSSCLRSYECSADLCLQMLESFAAQVSVAQASLRQ